MMFYKSNCSLLILVCLLVLSSCFREEPADEPAESDDIQLIDAFPNLTFTRPVDLQHAGDASDRLFVVEQRGRIMVFENAGQTDEAQLFLDLQDIVKDEGNEEGLLGLAFHPDYVDNGFFYVNYTAPNPSRTIISRFSVSDSDPDQADAGSELILMEIEQPYTNHNGGQLAFGPDGYLYIAVGDGGSGGDPQGNGQNLETVLGSILRIDVNGAEAGMNYAIPESNPFAGNVEGYREEIFAYGLRNVWKFSFDRETGTLWAADVGQNRFEEINWIENGGNYGWNTMEGFECFNPESDCDKEGLILPLSAYAHSEGNASVTGGYVYRAGSISELERKYVYADFVSGRVWALDFSTVNEPEIIELAQASFPVSSFGLDEHQELYLCGFDGKIYRFGYHSGD
ncbi:Glucose/arabinose dehydrogenase, beta-propeller fold [Cyclobacterium lianum]|uniref:Glucose/arabinose dehydrogenase, beta-propeller fold n=1 Tax=Cyclobacterium lianum TaxID=388280 RepID=A0A1M7NU26_9BACT|nr:PQQ-dependent sugar dehydrogenase [Cyclobacterium lianum]SHN07595.1 Glucose/arabinose dehydrogenase, beta-propeller fold [Cyclobacterium lianum]